MKMTVETIEANRSVMIPAICAYLIRKNIHGCGKEDAEDFARDYNEIFDLARQRLEQPEIIRCKDCEYKEKHGSEFYCDHITGDEIMVKPSDFCSWAERMQDETD